MEGLNYKRVRLKDVAYYVKDRMPISEINTYNYISTDNMIPNKRGIISSVNLPTSKTTAKASAGDILISNIRPYLKKIFLADKTYGVSNDILIIRSLDEAKASTKFLYYVLFRDYFFDYIMVSAKGVKMPRGDKDKIMDFEIYLPPIENQLEIVEVLSSFDKKIELNNQINKDLEELAQTIYKKWFVNFDFPNEEGKPYKSSGGEMVESELGLIPKEWNVENLAENSISTLIKAGIDEFEDAKIYLATAAVSNDSIIDSTKNVTYANRESRANMQPQPNSVWFAKMKSSKKILYFGSYSDKYLSEYLLSTGFCGIQCVENSLEYIWNFINRNEFENKKDSLSHGATQQSINNEDLKNIKLIVPPKKILSEFKELVGKLYELKYSNEIENISLVELRDTMLPYLMNGTLKIK